MAETMTTRTPAPEQDRAHPRGATLRRGLARLLRETARDTSGNVIIIAAASLFPLLALIGSGIDMGRGYLAQTRLQQACDAGTLAARKRLGTMAAITGEIPDEVGDTGQRFFNINFRTGAYGSEDRQFVMELEEDLAISGVASANVPTSIMAAFGYDTIPVSVACSAQINMPDTDIMLVLDTTGSMLWVNDGDSMTRMDALRSTVVSFHAQMEANKPAGTRIRYGFVPYSTNVNVGNLLEDDWLVDEWQYNFREARPSGRTEERPVMNYSYRLISGSVVDGTSYVAASCPSSTVTHTLQSETTDADGWTHRQVLERGIGYNCSQVDTGSIRITPRTYNDHLFVWSFRQNGTETVPISEWRYDTFDVDLEFLETSNSTTYPMGGNPGSPSAVTVTYRGCIEERGTYEITDYANVDLTRALDLDIDRVPDPANPATQWRPMLNELSFARELRTNGHGSYTQAPVMSGDEFVNAWWWGYGACPAPASKLREMTAAEVESYVNSLVPQGSTYHDIGMIWGGRLLSPTGLFASENVGTPGSNTSRHMIFLTDGQTAPLDISYGTYGLEAIDRRRWSSTSAMTLTETVENRFSFACEEVKKRNIQVWVISFGTDANPVMEACSGPERYFVADDADELETTFSEIARRMGELRIVR
jgi:hypothetical protein